MPAPDSDTFYIIYDDGSVEAQTLVGEPVLSKPGRIAGEIEYNQRLAAIEEHNSIYMEEIHAAEQAALKTDYDALIAAGIPEVTARRITGYNGD